ncbi:MAG TPA: GNVR domain-containing protein [Fimbriimonas sp.]|nr:GNVR domain-containing protein [Fimbriimonas sp.]
MGSKGKKTGKVIWAIGVLVAFPIGMNIFARTLPKRYTAEMRLMVDQATQQLPSQEGPLSNIDDIGKFAGPRNPQTTLDILTGSDVIDSAIAMAAYRLPNKVDKNRNSAAVYDDLVKRMTVDNELNSDILTIRVTQNDPEVAAELANDIGLAYTGYIQKLSKDAGAVMEGMLNKEITLAKSQLTDIDKKISDLKSKTQVYDVQQSESQLASAKSLADQRLASAQALYTGAAAQLQDAEQGINSIPKMVASTSRTTINPALVSLQQQLATEQANLAEARSKFQDDFPEVKHEAAKVAAIERQLKSLKVQVPGGVDMSPNPIYQSALTSLVQLRGQVKAYEQQAAQAKVDDDKATQDLAQIPSAEEQLQSLIRDRTVKEQNYEALAQRQTQLQAVGATRQANARIVSPALVPDGPSFPDSKMFSLAGLAMGAFLAVLIMMPRPEQEEVSEVVRRHHPNLTSIGPDDEPAPKPLGHEEESVVSYKRVS